MSKKLIKGSNELTKKLTILTAVLLLAFTVTACKKKNSEDEALQQEIYGVPATGLELDITDLNGQTATVTPGDILYLKLEGEAEAKKQWTVASPTSGDMFMLQNHQTLGLQDATALDGKFTDEWRLKIERIGNFNLQFDYGILGKKSESSFQINIVSQ